MSHPKVTTYTRTRHACESRNRGDFSGLSLENKVVIGAGTPGKEEES